MGGLLLLLTAAALPVSSAPTEPTELQCLRHNQSTVEALEDLPTFCLELDGEQDPRCRPSPSRPLPAPIAGGTVRLHSPALLVSLNDEAALPVLLPKTLASEGRLLGPYQKVFLSVDHVPRHSA